MSIVVDLAELEQALAGRDLTYLVLARDDRPHVVQVQARYEGADSDVGVIVVPHPGRTAQRIVPERPEVTLLLPPQDATGHTLLVDGSATIADDGSLRLQPAHAVLHRAAFVGDPHRG